MSIVRSIIVGILISALITPVLAFGQGSGTITQLQQWFASQGFIKTSSSTAKLWIPGLASSGDCLVTDATGKVSTATCGTGGGGTGDSVWSRLLRGSIGVIYNPTTTDVVLIGSTATNSLSRLEVNGGATIYGTATTSNVVATSTTATNTLPVLSSATATISNLNGVIYVDGSARFPKTGAGIQNALDFKSNQGGGTVCLTDGTYSISTNINMRSNVFLTSCSGSPASVIINLSSAKGFLFDTVYNAGITKLKIDGSSQVAFNKAVEIVDSTNITVDSLIGVNLTGFGVFIEATPTGSSSKIYITNNKLDGLGNNDVIGGGPQQTTGGTTTDIFVNGNYVVQNSTGGGTYFNAFDIVACQHCKVQNNIFEGNVLFGYEQSPHNSSEITNNTIKPAPSRVYAGIAIQSRNSPTNATTSDKALTVSGNIINSGYISVIGISLLPARYVNITNNTIKACGTGLNCLFLNFVSSAIISGNIFQGISQGAAGSGLSAVYVSNSTNLLITGNNFSNNDVVFTDATGVSSIQITNNFIDGYNTFASGTVQAVIFGNKGYDTNNIFGTFGIGMTGTTSQWAKLTIQNDFGSTLPLFEVSTTTSSTGATSSLFRIDRTGSTTASNGFNITAGCYSILGVCLTGGSPYPFPLTGNATSSTVGFNAGLLSLASTTIGGGTSSSGLTILGDSTTTGRIIVQGLSTSTFAYGVGIGTTTIGGLLTVSSVGSTPVNSNNATTLLLNRTTGSVGAFGVGFANGNTNLNTQNDLVFSTGLTNNGGTTGVAQRMVLVSSTGNVGIGTTSPYAKLSVVGKGVFETIDATSTTATSTLYNVQSSSTLTTNLNVLNYFTSNGLTSCNGASNALTWNNGVFGCNTITGGGGGSAGAWATSSNNTLTYLPSTWTALIGGTATTSNSKLEVVGEIRAHNFIGTSTATSTFGNLQGCYEISDTSIDWGIQANKKYIAGWGNNVCIRTLPGVYTQNVAQYPFNASTTGKRVTLIGAGGDATIINLTGAGTSTTLNPGGSGTLATLKKGWGIYGMTFHGDLTANQVGIVMGGDKGVQGAIIDSVVVGETDTGLVLSDNLNAGITIRNSILDYNNRAVYANFSTDAGEGINFEGNNISNCQLGHVQKCIWIRTTSGSSIHFDRNEMDDVQMYIADGNKVSISNSHMENADVTLSSTTPFIVNDTGGFGSLSITGTTFVNNGANSSESPHAFILSGNPTFLSGNMYFSPSYAMPAFVGTFGTDARISSIGDYFPLVSTPTTYSTSTAFDLLVNPISHNIGIGTSSPYSRLSVVGQVVAQNFVATSTTASSTFKGLFAENASTTDMTVLGKFWQGGLGDCTGAANKVVYTLSTGKLGCATDQTGGGTATDTPWQMIPAGLRLTTTTNQVLIGAAATTTLAKLEVQGNTYVNGNATTTGIASSTLLFVSSTSTVNGISASYLTLNGGNLSAGTGVFSGRVSGTGFDGSATSTFSGLTASSTYVGNVNNVGGFFQAGLSDCSGEAQTVSYTLATGKFGCLSDGTSAGGSGTTTDIWQWAQGLARLNTTTQQVLIGALATTSRAGLEVIAQGSNPALYLNGRVGVGTTSPDSALSVVMGSGNVAGIHLDNTANNAGYMLYANDGFGDIMYIDQYGSLYNTTVGINTPPDGTVAPLSVGAPNGVSAVMYGKLTVGTSTDQFGRAASSTLLVDGPIESTKKFVGCDSIVPNVGAAITADSALTNCPGFVFDESTDGEVRAVTAADVNNMATTSQYIVMQGTVTATPSPAAGDGIAMRMASNNATATNSPMMEAEVRVNSTIVATSTAHNISFVGFTSHAYSVTTGAASLNLHPTDGAYFMAASSSNNWVARTAANNVFTETDTGIAHSASTHPFQTLRVDLQESGKAVFLINGRVVAVHTTNLPVRPMTPIVTQAVATAGGAASPIQVSRLKAWLGFLGYLGQ